MSFRIPRRNLLIFLVSVFLLGGALALQILSSPAWRAESGLAQVRDGMTYNEVNALLIELGGTEAWWFGQGEQERFWQFSDHYFIHIVWDTWTPLEDGNRNITDMTLVVRGNLTERILGWVKSMKTKMAR